MPDGCFFSRKAAMAQRKRRILVIQWKYRPAGRLRPRRVRPILQMPRDIPLAPLRLGARRFLL